jgi:hypothetical protein
MYWTGVGFGPYATYDLNTNTLVSSGAANGTFVSSNIEELDNGWVRLSVTGSGNYTSLIVANDIRNAANLVPGVPFAGVGESFYIWGAQTELGSYSTSYIPTTSASVTRNADVISKTGISSLIGQTEGTLFADVYFDSNIGGNKMISGLTEGASAFIYFFISNSDIVLSVYNAGDFQAYLTYTLPSSGQYKVAAVYKNNEFAIYVNGVSVATDNLGSVPTCSTLYLGNDFLSVPNKIEYKSLALWKTRLTNTQLAQLTSI